MTVSVVGSSPVLPSVVVALALAALAPGCLHPRPGGVASILAVLPAESDAYPAAAEAATRALTDARVDGVSRQRVSEVSLEVVQLSIECVEPTPACYAAAGRSLSVGQLLFAQLARGARRREVKVSVTRFDVAAERPTTVAKVFPNEKAAVAGMGALVDEAVRAPARGGP